MPLSTCLSVPAHPLSAARALLCAAALLATAFGSSVWAQPFPITAAQRATADQVAQAGVPLSELAANAPHSHTVERGDTLWAISSLFLKSPWRWPELWGMNRQDIRNPHLIFPGQVLYLDTSSGRAILSTRAPGAAANDLPTVRLSPRTRVQALDELAIAPVSLQAIKAFLSESEIVDEASFARAPRIVATQETRVLLSRGDRAYARAQYSDTASPEALTLGPDQARELRVFRNAVPLKDPATGEVLGFEAQFLGKARLVRGESSQTRTDAQGQSHTEIVPATIDIVFSRQEMRIGDRLLPAAARDWQPFVPSTSERAQDGQIVSVYGDAVSFVGQNQVVAINRGRAHGLERGHVLAVLRDSHLVTDRTDPAQPQLRLPGERNGLMMVFRTFDKLSYALVLQIADGVKVGDHFSNP
ncbi:LysM domain-containing protein [Hydrogenophaga sp.]|uniref:LysM peptidoglycan-binding domain-containing protein n=1 Tax=Hydrogenophaga sp. TaxID=1904254 RepID=UPI0019BC66A2|nr:LysM domain-containing protein [Hydrogenophaga sp.]MBD3893150.1 LysM peptidoglycan-binding domain-containing protein [Hydrogenophaga sp.]